MVYTLFSFSLHSVDPAAKLITTTLPQRRAMHTALCSNYRKLSQAK